MELIRRAALLAPIVLLGACTTTQIHERTLDNGLKIIVQENHRAPVVVSQVWYKVGAIDEPEGLTGISHVLEHLMFKGTKTLKPGEFSRIIAAEGGRENAFTGNDYTAYFQTLEKSRLPVSFRLEADRMQNLVFDESEFQKEAAVVREERRLRTEDNPEALTYEQFNATAYTVHPYRHPIVGWMKDLEAHTLDDMKQWYSNWYAPNNATLVVAGDVRPAEVFSLAEQYFGKLPVRKTARRNIPAEPAQTSARHSTVKAPAKVPYYITGYHVPVLGHGKDEDVYALSVLAGVLDGGNSARLTRELVRGSQVAASAGAGFNGMARGPGMFMLDGTPASGKTVAELESALMQQVERLKQEMVSEDELKRIKAQVLASDIFGRDSVFYQAMRIGMMETIGLDYRTMDDYLDNIKKVTPEKMREVAQKYLVVSNQTTTVLEPQPMNTKSRRKPMPGGGHGRH
ncbi:MAG: insulinase family protein [Gammaproteobacteria bacterium]|nr:insulinase family protein [Gammaproteobacteria bacterium]